MRLIEGRDISWDDDDKKRGVVIINQTVARRLWPGEDAVGRMALAGGTEARVVGVIADVRETSVEGNVGWQMYLPATQFWPMGAQLVVRTKLPPETLASSVMKYVAPDQPGAACHRIPSPPTTCGSRGFATALLPVARHLLRRAGSSTGFTWDLRRHLVFGGTADPGNRHSHGVGGNPGSGAVSRHWKDTVAGTHRNRNRDGGVIRNLQFDCLASFRNPGQRSGYFPEHDLVAAAGGAARRLHTGATRLAYQPNDCPTQQLIPCDCSEAEGICSSLHQQPNAVGHHASTKNQLVNPTEAKRSGGTCCFPTTNQTPMETQLSPLSSRPGFPAARSTGQSRVCAFLLRKGA